MSKRPETTVRAISMAAHRVTAPTIAKRLGIPLDRAQAHVAEYRRWRVRKREAPVLIADCMARLGITGAGYDYDEED